MENRPMPVKMVLHALDATPNDATELLIYFPDMDVLVLSLRSTVIQSCA